MTVEKQKNQNAFAAKLLEYVEKNYMNSDLSLSILMENFKIDSISYVSRLFKEYSGENFSIYLENLRIEKACELLDSNKYSIKKIAIMVGYLSDASFRRAFKKQKGVNPTRYKNLKIN